MQGTTCSQLVQRHLFIQLKQNHIVRKQWQTGIYFLFTSNSRIPQLKKDDSLDQAELEKRASSTRKYLMQLIIALIQVPVALEAGWSILKQRRLRATNEPNKTIK